MLSFEILRTPRPIEIVVTWESQELHVTYDRAAFVVEMTEGVYGMPIRERMRRVLLGWDLLKGGQPWQPTPKEDEVWEKAVYAARTERAQAGRDADHPLTDADRRDIAQQPISFAERATVYESAWDAIIAQLPRAFIRAVDTGILDDFLGVIWRGATSANGSAPAVASGGSFGGTSV